MTNQSRVMSVASVPDCEIAQFSFETSPSLSKSTAVLDLSASSAASVDTPSSSPRSLFSGPIFVDMRKDLGFKM